jgi:L-ascorbate metabolism protein UlaG (beta-lactamase superfamily)
MSKVKYYGHSCVTITNGDNTILIDPFLDGNPQVHYFPVDLKPSLILVTHGHDDHLGDALKLAKSSGAPILANFELANYCEKKGARTIGAHLGGTVKLDFCTVKLVPAWHSSSTTNRETGEVIYLGQPSGFVITVDRQTFYHAGDTCVFGDMALISELTPVDVALLPIGGLFTMDTVEAMKAIDLIKPKAVIPIHYNTFNNIIANPDEIRNKLRDRMSPIEFVILRPGAEYNVPPL